ncbi:MAG: FecR family protein [Steroidobacteraceae bacterium]
MNVGRVFRRRHPARDQSASWLTRINRGLSIVERQDFESWIAEPANAREYNAQRYLLDMSMELKGRLRADVLDSVGEIRPARRQWFAPARLWASGAVTVIAVLTVTFSWSVLRSEGYVAQTYQTATGQVHNVVLPDGSIVGLNTQTELQWVGSPSDRRVRLIRGEAYFQVVHDPSRPFRILLAHSQVQVLGTRFDVYQMANGDARVSVISGAVAVEALDNGQGVPSWSRRLTSGQQIEYSPVGLVADVHFIVAPKVIRWREGMLETQGEPLKDFVSDLSRYTSERIVIADPRAATQQVGGAFSVRDINSTLDRLSRIAPVSVTHDADEVVLGYRPVPTKAGPGGAPER